MPSSETAASGTKTSTSGSFRATMKRIHADLSEGELRDLEKRFAVPSSSSSPNDGIAGSSRVREGRAVGSKAAGLRYVEMLRWAAPGRESRGQDDEIWAVEERLRQMIRARFDIWIPGDLRKAFRHFDARRKDKVSEADLSDGLRRLGMELTTRQERELFRTMDLDVQGFLVYPDLVVFARDPNHHDVRGKVLRQLKRVNKSRIRAELESRDPSGSGVISEQALGKVLAKFGADLAGADLGRLMHRFDVHEDGIASIDRVVSFFRNSGATREGVNSDDSPGHDRSTQPQRRSSRLGGGSYSDGEGDGPDAPAISGARKNSTSTRDSTFAANLSGSSSSSKRRKEVTFRDKEGHNRHKYSHKNTLRSSLRRLILSSTDNNNKTLATEEAAAAVGTGSGISVGPGLRDKLLGALQIAAIARGARRGGMHIDRETIRRAMLECGAPLDSMLLRDLERRFDRRGTGEINVESFVDYIVGEAEAGVWERVAEEMASVQQHRTSGSSRARDGFVRGFISDLTRFVDAREEISRRELRKALERQGGLCTLREEEILVLCDSLDPERRGRVQLSDVRDALSHGVVDAGLSSEYEDKSDDEHSSTDSAAAFLDDLRLLVRAAERERGVDLLKSFEHFDRRRQGEVSKDEFWGGLRSLGLGRDLSRSHISRMVESFKGRKHGYVRYEDFVKAMAETPSHRGDGARLERRKGGKAEGGRRRSSPHDVERLVDRLKAEIGRLTEEEDGPPPFREVFEAADNRGEGTLPSLAFRRCLLEGLGLNLTETECEALLEYLDTGGDNNISYREFLQFVGHEVRERTPPRSRSPRGSADSAAAGSVGGGGGAGSGDDFVHSPPRRRQPAPSPGRRRSRGYQ